MRHDPRAMLSPWPCGGRARIEVSVDERCASVIESPAGADREKHSSSPSYGDEPEFIHCPKTSPSLAASWGVKCTSVPFSACSLRSSLRVRFPVPVRLPACGSSASGLGWSPTPPCEGNATRVGAAALALEGSIVDSG